MCKADADLITMKWVREESWAKERPWPDFSVVKECRNFEALVDWARRERLDGRHLVSFRGSGSPLIVCVGIADESS
jgi:hypothetical protein